MHVLIVCLFIYFLFYIILFGLPLLPILKKTFTIMHHEHLFKGLFFFKVGLCPKVWWVLSSSIFVFVYTQHWRLFKKNCGDPLRKQFKATGTVCIFPEKHKLAVSAVTKILNSKQRYRFLFKDLFLL